MPKSQDPSQSAIEFVRQNIAQIREHVSSIQEAMGSSDLLSIMEKSNDLSEFIGRELLAHKARAASAGEAPLAKTEEIGDIYLAIKKHYAEREEILHLSNDKAQFLLVAAGAHQANISNDAQVVYDNRQKQLGMVLSAVTDADAVQAKMFPMAEKEKQLAALRAELEAEEKINPVISNYKKLRKELEDKLREEAKLNAEDKDSNQLERLRSQIAELLKNQFPGQTPKWDAGHERLRGLDQDVYLKKHSDQEALAQYHQLNEGIRRFGQELKELQKKKEQPLDSVQAYLIARAPFKFQLDKEPFNNVVKLNLQLIEFIKCLDECPHQEAAMKLKAELQELEVDKLDVHQRDIGKDFFDKVWQMNALIEKYRFRYLADQVKINHLELIFQQVPLSEINALMKNKSTQDKENVIAYQIENANRIQQWQLDRVIEPNKEMIEKKIEVEIKSGSHLPYREDFINYKYGAQGLPAAESKAFQEQVVYYREMLSRSKSPDLVKLDKSAKEMNAMHFIQALKELIEGTKWTGTRFSFYTSEAEMNGKKVYLRAGVKDIYERVKRAESSGNYQKEMAEIIRIGQERAVKKTSFRDDNTQKLYDMIAKNAETSPKMRR